MLVNQQQQQHNAGMVSITIRDVPQEVRNELAARAARSGRSLQEFLRGELVTLAERPDHALVMARIRERVAREGVHLDVQAMLDGQDADRR